MTLQPLPSGPKRSCGVSTDARPLLTWLAYGARQERDVHGPIEAIPAPGGEREASAVLCQEAGRRLQDHPVLLANRADTRSRVSI
jgi:hypothetical protein